MQKCLCILFYSMALSANCQEAETESGSQQRFVDIGTGVNFSAFTDFATSPRAYTASARQFSLGFRKITAKRERDWNFRFSTGRYSTSFENGETSGSVRTLFVRHGQLYPIPNWSTTKTQVSIGWAVDATGNFRVNESLQNNGIGLEGFLTGFGSVKLLKDLSRNKPVERRRLIGGGSKTLQPRKRWLTAQLNVAVLPSSFRNGYAYSNNTAITREPNPFDGYEFKVLSGYRVSSNIAYTIFNKNGNAIVFA